MSVDIYSELPLNNKRDIRLLQFKSTANGVVSCQLSVVNLDSKPDYIALSYTWGPATKEEEARGVTNDPVCAIICNEKSILVTKNLYGFLRRAAKNTFFSSKFFWIDIVCINQLNTSERTEQVMLMAAIYSSARSVTVWLGEEDEHTKPSFELMKKLVTCPKEDLKTIRPGRMSSPITHSLLEAYSDMSYWSSLKKLFERNYFNRVWIIQEITLARATFALCGNYSIKWDHIVKISEFLTVTSWTRWISPSGKIPAGDMKTHQSHHSLPNTLEANRRTKAAGNDALMLYSLIRSRGFVSKDPRDKVYALLGICGDSIATKPGFTPVYDDDRTAATTFINAAIQILQDSNDLLLLAHAEGKQFQTLPSLPSWVPDWSCNRLLGLGITGYTRFYASGNLPRSLSINERELRLAVHGFMLDRIVAVGECKHQILKHEPFPQTLSLYQKLPEIYHTGQPRVEVFWRTMITDTAGPPRVYPAPPSWGQAFISWMSSILTTQSSSYTHDYLEMFKISASGIYGSDESCARSYRPTWVHDRDAQASPGTTVDADAYETTFSHSPHLRPFLTSNKYLGMGSQSLEKGHSIWIIPGSRVPLILQTVDSGIYKIVGGAYVHGFMHGEALDVAHDFQDIILI